MTGYLLLALAIAAGDQLIKFWVRSAIPLHTVRELIPGVLSLTYVQNRGAAFSSLEGQQWLFLLVFAGITAAIVWEAFRNSMHFSPWEWGCIAAIWGGGLGNMIDRIRLGYVVDMIRTEFIDFPIFNAADCFITCGCALLMILLLVKKKEDPHGNNR